MSDAAAVAEAAAREVLEAPAYDPGMVADRAVAARPGAAPRATKQRGRTGSVAWDASKHKRGFHGRFAPGSQEEQTATAQQQLHKHGEDPGPIDGQHGPRTESATKRFQAKYGLKQTGKLDAGTVATLHAPPPKSMDDLRKHGEDAKAKAAAEKAAKGGSRSKSGKSRKSGRQSGGTAAPAGRADWQGQLSMSGVMRHGDGTQTKHGRDASRGSAQVQQLQAKLEQLGFDLGDAGTDGKFGDATQAAVEAFQRAYGLTADGVVGRHTKLMLNLLSQMEDDDDPNALSIDQMPLSKRAKGSGGAKGARAQLSQMGVREAAVAAERAVSAQLRS